MLNFRQIEVFRATMLAKTVRGAADLLHVSQPGVSQILKHMESRLGIRLFDRLKGRLVPTPEALELFGEIQKIYKYLDNLNYVTQRISRGVDSVLRIGSSPSIGRYFVPHALTELRRRMPDLALHLDIISVDETVDYLLSRKGEHAVTIFPIAHPLIDSQLIDTGELLCVIPKAHRFAHRASLDVRELRDEVLISFRPDAYHWQAISAVCSEAGLQLNVHTFVRFAETACHLVESGLGIALGDEFTVMKGSFARLATVRL